MLKSYSVYRRKYWKIIKNLWLNLEKKFAKGDVPNGD